jgi:N-acetylmuramoyl-L-alanine amidase
MKDILDTLIDTIVSILIIGMRGYVLLCVGAYKLTAASAPSLTKEQEIVAKTILGEARGEGKAGMYAVACVIAQRAVLRNKTPKQICEQPSQFSFWVKDKRTTLDDKNRATVGRLMKHDIEIVRYAKTLAVHVMNLDRSYTGHSDHYCTISVNPYWAKGRTPVRVIGNHKFFRINSMIFGVTKSAALTKP